MRYVLLATSGLLLAGCGGTPTGPNTMVWPGPHKTLEAFSADKDLCKGYASADVDGSAHHNNFVQAAVPVGAGLLGAGVGAAATHSLSGAALGGATGLLGGSMLSGLHAGGEQDKLQLRYDAAFAQCMRLRGNDIPGLPPLKTTRR